MNKDDPHLLYVLGLSLLLPLVFVGGNSGMDAPAPPSGAIIEENYLMPVVPPFLVEAKVAASLVELPPIMTRVAIAESGLNPRARNKRSNAKGLFQVIPKSERFCEKGLGRQLNMYNPLDNAECAKYLMSHGGLSHWQESKGRWK